MSGRKIRRLLLAAAVVGLGYWIYKARPTVPGIIDSITNPLMGSHAAVKTSERNRVVGDATSVITEQTEQTELPVGSLREGMTTQEVRDLLGAPDLIEKETKDGVKQVRWTYKRAARRLVLENERVVSITVIR
jgi:hypothetical protein